MNVTDDRKELFKAISLAQGEFTTVAKDKDNPFFKAKYAPLDSIIEMARPILTKHKLCAMQFTDIPDTGEGVLIETIIAHESGEYISGKLYLPAAKLDPQGFGSAITYGRRYALAAALGIVSDEDNDGNGIKGKDKDKKPSAPHENPPQAPNAEPKDAEYQGRVRMALQSLYGTDIAQKKAKIKELTTFQGKDGKTVEGVEDYRTLKGKRLEILCHKLEALAPTKEICAECQSPIEHGACRNLSCPNGKPYEDIPM